MTCVAPTFARTSACACVCTYAHMHVCLYVCVHICVYVCMHVCLYTCMRVCIYACMHVCFYVCVLICVYIMCVYSHKCVLTYVSHACAALLIYNAVHQPPAQTVSSRGWEKGFENGKGEREHHIQIL